MAIPIDTVWEVQSTGFDSNGGGWSNAQKGATGVDMSQGAPTTFSARLSATGTTTLTDSGAGFTNTMLGNIINIVAQGFYCIQGFTNSSTVTVDRALGTFSGVTGVVGGPLLSPAVAIGQTTNTNTVWTKGAGTIYAITSTTANVAGGRIAPTASAVKLFGYGSVRGDGGRPILQASGISSSTLVTFTGIGCAIENFVIDCNNLSSMRGASLANGRAYRCEFLNCSAIGAQSGIAVECEATNCPGSSNGGFVSVLAIRCVSHDNSTNGVGFSGGTSVQCIAFGNNVAGFTDSTGAVVVINCTAVNNAGDGLRLASGTGNGITMAHNFVSYGNTGWGVNVIGSDVNRVIYGLFVGSNTAGAVNGSAVTILNQVNLSASPFTNAAGGDYSLNNTAGGGAAVRGAGFPGTFPGISTTGHEDGGAVQHADLVVTFPPASKVYAGTDRGDGVLGTLHASNIATAAGSGVNLSAGILLSGNTVDDVVGSLTLPPVSKVYAGTDRGDGVLGTLHASNISIAAGFGSNLLASDLRLGTTVDNVTGTLNPAGGGGGAAAPVIIGGSSYAG